MERIEQSFIQTTDLRMQRVLDIASAVSLSRATVLIQGESGTGKELLARFIHAHSPRSQRRLVALNCAAVPEGLLESELFGYERGAFTGADSRKVGKFELAHNGTFFLDELSELSLPLQAKLLRVIQEGEIERLGGSHAIKVNVRIIAATNRNLKEMIAEKKFREDLYYRLNVVPLQIPPLRERKKDIHLLAHYFTQLACRENGLDLKRLEDKALKKLESWSWPGNVRELQNVIYRSVILCTTSVMSENDVLIVDSPQEKMQGHWMNEKDAIVDNIMLTPGMKVAEVEKILILKTLEHTLQNRTHAADLLGISIRTLRNKIKEYRNRKELKNESPSF